MGASDRARGLTRKPLPRPAQPNADKHNPANLNPAELNHTAGPSNGAAR